MTPPPAEAALAAPSTYLTPSERFWAYVEPADSGCLLWQGTRSPKGYGRFMANGRVVQAHRFAYEEQVGPIPDGKELDHLCRVRHCVNPEHLEPVTLAENHLRGVGITAINARKTHCLKGHWLGGTNLMKAPYRRCRICHNEQWRAGYWRRLASGEEGQ